MPVDAGIYPFLTGIDDLSAVGTRVEPAMSKPSSTLPRIRYTRVAEPTRHISNDGFSGLVQTLFQVDVIAATYAQAKALAAAIEAEDGYRGEWTEDLEAQQLRVFHVRDVPQPVAGGTGTAPFMVTLELTVWHQAAQ
jgi:hypothetical protein